MNRSHHRTLSHMFRKVSERSLMCAPNNIYFQQVQVNMQAAEISKCLFLNFSCMSWLPNPEQ